MAERLTTWRPDTCGCVIVWAWDDAVPEAERTHTAVPDHPQAALCAAHASPAAALAENQGKNRAIGIILERAPDLTLDDVTWHFDEQRQLHLDAPVDARTWTLIEQDLAADALITVVPSEDARA